MPKCVYEYSWLNGPLIAGTPTLLQELADLYSGHYGIWGERSKKPRGAPVSLSPARIRSSLTSNSKVALARLNGSLIGYAIAVRAKLRGDRVVSWVTQMVVHEDHRQNDVGKTLLFSIWGFSSHFAWGLVTPNPYAVRALEKATRRRCLPGRISKHKDLLLRTAIQNVPYITEETRVQSNRHTSRIDTGFFVDHSQLPSMLRAVTGEEKPWTLGDLEEGWEWLAFTFHDQPEIGLTAEEIEKMLGASDQAVKLAYARMNLDTGHRWAQHSPDEVQLTIEYCRLSPGQRILDIGSGNGRHVLELARQGFRATGVDYLEHLIRAAAEQAKIRSVEHHADFIQEDCRDLKLNQQFDAVISLYDVVGTYADDADNLLILRAIQRHLKPGGFSLISVMNFELTEFKAKNFFSLHSDPDALLKLEPSHTMERSGDIFNPNYYLIENKTGLVYRKEQFEDGNQLPVELVVRDRRYRRKEIEQLCRDAGLEVIWSRFVSAGRWQSPLEPRDDRAKEILLLCRRPEGSAE